MQLAKWLGAVVTGVCGTENVDLVRSLGADHVIDYTLNDFTNEEQRYDVIFDLVGDKPLLALRRVLAPTGIYVGAGVLGREASMIRMLPGMFNASILSLLTKQKFVTFMTKSDNNDLSVIAELLETGTVKPVIDRTFSLEEVPEAVRYVARKLARGKVVISIDQLPYVDRPTGKSGNEVVDGLTTP